MASHLNISPKYLLKCVLSAPTVPSCTSGPITKTNSGYTLVHRVGGYILRYHACPQKHTHLTYLYVNASKTSVPGVSASSDMFCINITKTKQRQRKEVGGRSGEGCYWRCRNLLSSRNGWKKRKEGLTDILVAGTGLWLKLGVNFNGMSSL